MSYRAIDYYPMNGAYDMRPMVANQRMVNYNTPLKAPVRYGQYTVNGTFVDDGGEYAYHHVQQPFYGCSINADCGKDSWCDNNVCQQQCQVDSQCPAGMRCQDNTCQPNECAADADCTSSMCDGGKCMVLDCQFDAECPLHSKCDSTPAGRMCTQPNVINGLRRVTMDERYRGMY